MEMVHSRDRNDKLLEFLTRRSVADFEKFIEVLSKQQAHLVRFLATDGGETIFTARRYASVVYAVVVCPSVRPCTCLSPPAHSRRSRLSWRGHDRLKTQCLPNPPGYR